ncbi:hypothetical protein [Methanovulcanius yangii]|uniref:hypothetical protein n=1 Tax=Methanovulcanius yangii TaxID=1789227 RepID=UPI0029CA97D3|nr:hypothetical protein [Methanovulcanius yangii]
MQKKTSQGDRMKDNGTGPKAGGATGVSHDLSGIAVACYLILAFRDYGVFSEAVRTFIGIILQILPVLVLVFVLFFVIDLFVRPQAIARHLGYESGIKGWILAVVAGIIATAPSMYGIQCLPISRKRACASHFRGLSLYAFGKAAVHPPDDLLFRRCLHCRPDPLPDYLLLFCRHLLRKSVLWSAGAVDHRFAHSEHHVNNSIR